MEARWLDFDKMVSRKIRVYIRINLESSIKQSIPIS